MSFERHPEDIGFGVLDRLLGYALRRAQIAQTLDFEASMAGTGFTPPLFAALTLVCENPGLPQTRLGQVMGLARSRITTLVDALERDGLLRRLAVAGDRRANGLAATAAGRRRQAALAGRVLAHDARIAAGLSLAERETLRRLLDRLG